VNYISIDFNVVDSSVHFPFKVQKEKHSVTDATNQGSSVIDVHTKGGVDVVSKVDTGPGRVFKLQWTSTICTIILTSVTVYGCLTRFSIISASLSIKRA